MRSWRCGCPLQRRRRTFGTAMVAPHDVGPSPDEEMDERFKKWPWLFRKGNKTGKAAQRRSAARLRMENLIQRLTNNGDVIVQFFCAVASGQPFMILVVKDLPGGILAIPKSINPAQGFLANWNNKPSVDYD